ncbi:MAG: 30S ribosomal protein S15 [Candidatus Pacearchaeota archaeon]|nr:30S ribosomal protein S15 [Candidatus Pacearchaeota archaeon]
MATMYGHGKGKARSHSPKPEKAYWVKMEAKELEELIVKLSKDGLDPAKIGLVLRDTYSIPNVKVITKKKIAQILKENGIDVSKNDLNNILKKEERIRRHIARNKVDKTAKRGLQLAQSMKHRLTKYIERKSK